jgi:hypothetical protein
MPGMQVSGLLKGKRCFLCSFPDRTGERYFHTIGWCWIAIVGYIIGITTTSVAGRYVALFLMAPGFTGITALRSIVPYSHLHSYSRSDVFRMGVKCCFSSSSEAFRRNRYYERTRYFWPFVSIMYFISYGYFHLR